jgi:hypothetical protein
VRPEFSTAAQKRSADSLTAASGRPARVKEGRELGLIHLYLDDGSIEAEDGTTGDLGEHELNVSATVMVRSRRKW